MRIRKERCLTMVIDIQERLFPHMYEKETLENKTLKLLAGLKKLEVPLCYTQQYTKGLGPTLPSVQKLLQGLDPIEKIAFSCWADKNCQKRLEDQDRDTIILLGIEAHVCVLQTALDLQESGFTPVVVEDCISSRNLEDKQVALTRMTQEGIHVTTYESLLFELCGRADSEVFKEISRIVK